MCILMASPTIEAIGTVKVKWPFSVEDENTLTWSIVPIDPFERDDTLVKPVRM